MQRFGDDDDFNKALATGTFERRFCCCCVYECDVRVAIAQPKLADQRNASPRAVCSICRLCDKAPWLLIVQHTTRCQSHIMGPISGSRGNHTSNMFEIPTRRTEGEHSLQ